MAKEKIIPTIIDDKITHLIADKRVFTDLSQVWRNCKNTQPIFGKPIVIAIKGYIMPDISLQQIYNFMSQNINVEWAYIEDLLPERLKIN